MRRSLSLSVFRRLGLLAMACAFSACGGGSSPSESESAPPGLAGSWAGTITLTTPGSLSPCTVALTLERQDGFTYLGNWNARCANGVQGNGFVVALPAFGDQVIVTAFSGEPLFAGCGWNSLATLERTRLRGDWSTPDDCATVLAGRIDLSKQR